MATAWDIIEELCDITARGAAGPPGGSGTVGAGRAPGPTAPGSVPGRRWGQRCHAGTPQLDPPLLSHAPGRGQPHSPRPSPCHHQYVPLSDEARAAEKVPTLCVQPLALGCGPPARAEPLLPPQRCFFPLGEMSPCGCGASHSDALFSASRLSFVWCINPTRLDENKPQAFGAVLVSSLDSQPWCCQLEEKHHPGWETGSLRWKQAARLPTGLDPTRGSLLRSRSTAFICGARKTKCKLKSLWAKAKPILKVFVLLSKEIECQIGFVKWQSN